MANVERKAMAIAVITPLRPWGRIVLAVVFWAGRHLTFRPVKADAFPASLWVAPNAEDHPR